MRKLTQEPLLHFLLLGALLFAVDAWRNSTNPSSENPTTIAVTGSVVERLRLGYERQFGQAPDEETLRGLVTAHVREEVLCREALALGLDQDDSIVRRRLAQKMEFLTDDLLVVAEPEEHALRQYFAMNAARYAQPSRVTFRHVYLSRDRRGTNTEPEALEVLETLKTGVSDESLGDPFLHGYTFEKQDTEELAATFGNEFLGPLSTAPTGKWFGPVPSPYGLHLVKVAQRSETKPVPLQTVREKVIQDFKDDRRRLANQELFERLRQRYRIQVDERAIFNATNPEVRTALVTP
ncbi:MAG: peptidyl-prolyl cis-trans isomerase [Verrucomicrobiales bacterium]|nr:peptidyl-prolyl cis-trans isomerase [Verrucomicrobiales bacterium]